MRYETVTIRHGENVGPVDWTHETARDMPPIWREAEQRPGDFVFSEHGREIIEICMYDGWPYWEPRPAVCYVGPLRSAEWAFFNSYGINAGSIRPARVTTIPAASTSPLDAAHSPAAMDAGTGRLEQGE